jgi:integrase
VQAWVNEMIAAGLSASQIRQSRQVMFAVMEFALDEGIIVKNPVKGVKAPRDKKREAVFLSAEEVQRLADAAEDRQPCLGGVMVYTLAYTGLRWGELAAIRHSRCDLLRFRLIVSESMTEVKGGVEFGPTKTFGTAPFRWHRSSWTCSPNI